MQQVILTVGNAARRPLDSTATNGGAVVGLYMPDQPSKPSVSDERALLRVLGASLRVASFKALMVRLRRHSPPRLGIAQPTPPELPRDVTVTKAARSN